MSVGDAILDEGRAVGETDDLKWDIRWQPSDIALWHVPTRIGRSRLPATRVVSPTVNALFTGDVQVGDETVHLRAARGCQTHLWGRQHAARWAWGHCNAFAENGSVVVEAVHAVPLLGRGREAPAGATFLYVEVDGEPIPCNAVPWVLSTRTRVEGCRWEIRGRTANTRVRAVLAADPEDMAQVTYEDPDGSRAWCANSEIARCVLEVERPHGTFQRYESQGLAHLEFGAREPRPDIPVLC